MSEKYSEYEEYLKAIRPSASREDMPLFVGETENENEEELFDFSSFSPNELVVANQEITTGNSTSNPETELILDIPMTPPLDPRLAILKANGLSRLSNQPMVSRLELTMQRLREKKKLGAKRELTPKELAIASKERQLNKDTEDAVFRLYGGVRRNALDNTIECGRLLPNGKVKQFDDSDFRVILRYLKTECGHVIGLDALWNIIGSLADDNVYSPLESIIVQPENDPTCGLLELWLSAFNVTDIEKSVMRKWVVRSSGHIVGYPTCANEQFMLVLAGPQGVGKDTALSVLAECFDGFTKEGEIKADQKDSRIALTASPLWVVSELDNSLKKYTASALKEFITLKIVKERAPYGRVEESRQTICAFAGCVNPSSVSGYLVDTENRRFFPIVIPDGGIDYDTIKATMGLGIEIWREAYTLLKSGFDYRFTKEELAYQREENTKSGMKNETDLYIEDYYEVDPDGKGLTTQEVAEFLKALATREVTKEDGSTGLVTDSKLLGEFSMQKVNHALEKFTALYPRKRTKTRFTPWRIKRKEEKKKETQTS